MKKHCGSSKRRPADVLVDEEIAVVERLQPEVAELQVALGVERLAELLEVVLRERVVEKADLDAVLDELRKVFGVLPVHVGLGRFLAHGFHAQAVQKQARRDVRVGRVLLDQRACGQHDALAHFVHRHAVVQVLQRALEDAVGIGVGETFAGSLHEIRQTLEIERLANAVLDDVDGVLGLLRLALLRGGALLGALFAIQDVRARDFMLAAAHERELDLILDLLDVDRAAFGLALHEGRDDQVRQTADLVANARAGRALAAVHGQERLGHGDGDLGRLEADHRPVAADNLVLGEARIGVRPDRTSRLAHHEVTRRLGRGEGGGGDVHGCFSSSLVVCAGQPAIRAVYGAFGQGLEGRSLPAQGPLAQTHRIPRLARLFEGCPVFYLCVQTSTSSA
jgi:hypothetical protein